jgi:enoyl-CoA hydratase/carnithine racemase
MGIIEIENNFFVCRREKNFAVITLKEQAMQILATVGAKEDLMSVLSSIENTPEIQGLAIIYPDEYPGDLDYKRFLEDLLEGRLHEGKIRYFQIYQTSIHQFLSIIFNFSVPIVSGMNGNMAPEDFGIILAFDFRLATEKTTFMFPNLHLGFPPSGVLSYLLIQNIGRFKAVDLLLTKSYISSVEAFDLGLITQLVSEEELEYQCIEKLKEMSNFPSYAISETRRLLQPDLSKVEKHIDATLESSLRNLHLMKA